MDGCGSLVPVVLQGAALSPWELWALPPGWARAGHTPQEWSERPLSSGSGIRPLLPRDRLSCLLRARPLLSWVFILTLSPHRRAG